MNEIVNFLITLSDQSNEKEETQSDNNNNNNTNTNNKIAEEVDKIVSWASHYSFTIFVDSVYNTMKQSVCLSSYLFIFIENENQIILIVVS
jgi:hypothetical protein